MTDDRVEEWMVIECNHLKYPKQRIIPELLHEHSVLDCCNLLIPETTMIPNRSSLPHMQAELAVNNISLKIQPSSLEKRTGIGD